MNKICFNPSCNITLSKYQVKYCSQSCANSHLQIVRSAVKRQKLEADYYANPKTCIWCNTVIDYEKKNNKFCNHSCFGHYNNEFVITDNSRKKQAKSLSNTKSKNNKIWGPYSKAYLCVCKYTGLKFYSNSKNRIHPSVYEKIEHYRQLCKFQFNITDYSEWFSDDIKLLGRYGWYSPANRGNNLNGVSKDHMVSVLYGFQNNIDPKIISHPANCKLMVHSENNKKNNSCSIQIEQLLERIKLFDELK